MPNSPTPPVVLVFAGLDPCGGAGIQADIETIVANGGHAASLITCLTVQDTRTVYRLEPVAPELVLQQARTLLADLPIAAVKLGLLGSAAMVEVVSEILQALDSHVPVVCDPVLAAGGGQALASQALMEAMHQQLLPHVTLLTPNSLEARRLSGCDDLAQAARTLCEAGCDYTLITGTHEHTQQVIHRCYTRTACVDQRVWERLAGEYHGSGCTLASSIATQLAQGHALETALQRAQHYTWHSLQAAVQLGQGQALPRRA